MFRNHSNMFISNNEHSRTNTSLIRPSQDEPIFLEACYSLNKSIMSHDMISFNNIMNQIKIGELSSELLNKKINLHEKHSNKIMTPCSLAVHVHNIVALEAIIKTGKVNLAGQNSKDLFIVSLKKDFYLAKLVVNKLLYLGADVQELQNLVNNYQIKNINKEISNVDIQKLINEYYVDKQTSLSMLRMIEEKDCASIYKILTMPTGHKKNMSIIYLSRL